MPSRTRNADQDADEQALAESWVRPTFCGEQFDNLRLYLDRHAATPTSPAEGSTP